MIVRKQTVAAPVSPEIKECAKASRPSAEVAPSELSIPLASSEHIVAKSGLLNKAGTGLGNLTALQHESVSARRATSNGKTPVQDSAGLDRASLDVLRRVVTGKSSIRVKASSGDPAFESQVHQALATLMSRPMGRKLVHELDRAPHPVEIRATTDPLSPKGRDGDCCIPTRELAILQLVRVMRSVPGSMAIVGPMLGTLNLSREELQQLIAHPGVPIESRPPRGQGRGSTVFVNPLLYEDPDKAIIDTQSGKSVRADFFITLAHELHHAKEELDGTTDPISVREEVTMLMESMIRAEHFGSDGALRMEHRGTMRATEERDRREHLEAMSAMRLFR